jgi:hypothetical protein
VRKLPRSQWSVFIPNHHEGFIDIATYEANGPPLLQGIRGGQELSRIAVLGKNVFLPDGFWNWALPECSILKVRIIRSGPIGCAEGC